MANLLNKKIKSFRLHKGKTSIKQIGLILIVALFFIGLVWLAGRGVDRGIDNSKVAPKKLSETEKELKLQEQVAGIIETKSFTQCEQIKYETYKTVCVNNIALNLAKETQDISYCQKIDDKFIPRSDCERQVVFAKSIEKENIAACKETANQELQKQCEDSFYSQLALKKNDVKVCKQIMEKDKADFCYNNFLVMKKFAQDSKNFDCLRLRGENMQNDCKSLKETQNFLGCPELKTNLFSQYCFLRNQ